MITVETVILHLARNWNDPEGFRGHELVGSCKMQREQQQDSPLTLHFSLICPD